MTDTSKMKGLLFVVSGYSGVGKGTVLEMVLNALPSVQFSISCTSRNPRKGEEDGVNYYFLTEQMFEKHIENDDFVEYTKTFTNYYGTLKSEIQEPIKTGIDVLLELNVVGAENIKQLYPDCVTIFITPPSIDALKARLIGRGSETPESLERRLKEIEIEGDGIKNYDYVITNNIARECCDKIISIITSEHLKVERKKHKVIFNNLEDNNYD